MSKRVNWLERLEKELKEYRKEAKRANQRMLRLERYSDPSDPMYRPEAKEVKKFAYRVAQRDLKALLGSQATRFKENFKLPDADSAKSMYYKILSLRETLNTFLTSASSTIDPIKKGKEIIKPGLRTVYDNRTKTINDKYITKYGGEGFTSLELAKYFNSKRFKDLQDYGSKQAFMIAATIRSIPTDPEDIRDYLKKHIDFGKLTNEQMKLFDTDASIDEDIERLMQSEEGLNQLYDLMTFTKSKVLNRKVKKALKAGITPENIFL